MVPKFLIGPARDSTSTIALVENADGGGTMAELLGDKWVRSGRKPFALFTAGDLEGAELETALAAPFDPAFPLPKSAVA